MNREVDKNERHRVWTEKRKIKININLPQHPNFPRFSHQPRMDGLVEIETPVDHT